MTWVRLKWLAQREGLALEEFLRNIEQYPDDVGPLTRKNIKQFWEQIEVLQDEIEDERIDKIVNILFDRLDMERTPYRKKELNVIESQLDISNLGLVQDVLYSALNRQEQIQITASYGIDEYCSAYILSQTLKTYLNQKVEVRHLSKENTSDDREIELNRNAVNILIGDFDELVEKDLETRTILIGTTFSEQS